VDGCVKIRGEAKSKDLHLLMFAMEGEQKTIKDLVNATLSEHQNMRKLLTAALERMSFVCDRVTPMGSARTETRRSPRPPNGLTEDELEKLSKAKPPNHHTARPVLAALYPDAQKTGSVSM